MPAIITHDQFGREALVRNAAPFVQDRRSRAAFLLGNQGPDPLFYCIANPLLLEYGKLGNHLHAAKPTALLAAVARSVAEVPHTQQDVVRAWAAGFLCHYLLDRTVHPLVYAQQFALCKAGVEGLTERDGSEVHAIIESELDEMVLFCRMGCTVEVYSPEYDILRCDEQALAAISYALHHAVTQAYRTPMRPDLYRKSVHSFRRVQRLFHSPTGTKHAVVGAVERLARPHSFAQAMMHRPVALTECRFDNHEGATWENPFTHELSTETFWGLFDTAANLAVDWVGRFVGEGFDEGAAAELTGGLNFSGEPVEG